ncbi:MAG: dipeptidase [Chlorobi bacterium]|nr:dipeptidase [Chlorobiota bacterium]
MKKIISVFLLSFIIGLASSFGCTNLLVTKGASANGSSYIVYTNDGEWLYHLKKYPAADYPEGEWLQIGSGKIKQVRHTYARLGWHMNEYQVSIGETTFTGREELWSKNNFLKYWHLIDLALQRAKTAREAIKVITGLVEEYGYGSEGESFSIGDPDEVWILEMIGNGSGGKGAIWVAVRIPDGYVAAHANHSRIGTFPLDDPENCMYSENVISFAVEKGYYDPESGEPFEFNKVYDPSTPEKLKYSETRVWSLFRRIAPSLNLSPDYHRGLTNKRYPLYIKPDKKLTTKDIFGLIRDHYEGTPFDMTKGIMAGPYGSPQRNRPLSFYVDSVKYSWERPISTYNTAFSFVAEMRSYLPDPIGGIVWFGEDDTYSTCYVPMYNSITEIPESFTKGDINKFSLESAWWAFNFVGNYVNLRYSDMIEDVKKVQSRLEDKFLQDQDSIESLALDMLDAGDKDKMLKFLTDYSVTSGEDVTEEWRQLGFYLVTKYNDGYVKDENRRIKAVGYPEQWYRRVIECDGDKYRIKDATEENQVKSF